MCVAKRAEDSCTDWTYERDWDCWYNDIGGAVTGKEFKIFEWVIFESKLLMFEILLKVSTLDECKDRCLMNQPACTAVAYTTPQHPSNPNRCWMKTALENCRESEGYITGNSHLFI